MNLHVTYRYIISLPLSNAAGTCLMHMQDRKYKTKTKTLVLAKAARPRPRPVWERSCYKTTVSDPKTDSEWAVS